MRRRKWEGLTDPTGEHHRVRVATRADPDGRHLMRVLRERAIARLTPMERSARISRLRDEIELHPERERACLAQIEEIERASIC